MAYQRENRAAGRGPGPIIWVALLAIGIIIVVAALAMSAFGFFGPGETNLPSTPIPITPGLPEAPGLQTEPNFTR